MQVLKTVLFRYILLLLSCLLPFVGVASSSKGELVMPSGVAPVLSYDAIKTLVYDTICVGDTLKLTAVAEMDSYLWSNDSTTQSIRVAPVESTWFWVDMVYQDTVFLRDSTFVTVYSLPEIVSSSADTLLIEAGHDTLVWVEVDEGATVLWNTGSTETEITVSPKIDTQYTVEVSNADVCSIGKSFLVQVSYFVDLEFVYDTVCFGDTTLIRNITQTNDSITAVLWDLDSDGQFDDAEGDTVKHAFASGGTHLVGMRVYFEVSNMNSTYNAVPVGSIPVVDFEYENTCKNATTLFTDLTEVTTGFANKWFWDFGDGKTDFFQNTSNYYTDAGTFEVQLNVWTNLGCTDSIIKSLIVNIAPSFNFITSKDSIITNNDTVYYAKGGSEVVSIDIQDAYDSIEWYNGSTEMSITISEEGVYNAVVYYLGCESEARFVATEKSSGGGGSGTEIMNMFTPNGDGFNDYWFVSNPEVVFPIKLNIYSRGGKSVYSSDSYQNDWDGQSKGNPLPQGTYYYIIQDAVDNTFKGPVTIIR